MRGSIVFLLLSLAAVAAHADNELPNDQGIRLDKQMSNRWQAGVMITAAGPCKGIVATVPIPTDWPEQHVEIVKEDVSSHVKSVAYRTLQGGVKQMVISIPRLRGGQTAKAVITCKVTRRSILAPAATDHFKVPKRVSRKMRVYLGASPYIETRNARIRRAAREATRGKEVAWEKVEAIYDWVREHVQYEFDKELRGAAVALRAGKGDCEELTSLFVAMCRLNKIPARCVWVPDHCYPEFYLLDDEGKGHWIPCQAAGKRDFGGIPEMRPILQKGDSFRVPEKKKRQRYVAEFLKVDSLRGAKPRVRWVKGLLGPTQPRPATAQRGIR